MGPGPGVAAGHGPELGSGPQDAGGDPGRGGTAADGGLPEDAAGHGARGPAPEARLRGPHEHGDGADAHPGGLLPAPRAAHPAGAPRGGSAADQAAQGHGERAAGAPLVRAVLPGAAQLTPAQHHRARGGLRQALAEHLPAPRRDAAHHGAGRLRAAAGDQQERRRRSLRGPPRDPQLPRLLLHVAHRDPRAYRAVPRAAAAARGQLHRARADGDVAGAGGAGRRRGRDVHVRAAVRRGAQRDAARLPGPQLRVRAHAPALHPARAAQEQHARDVRVPRRRRLPAGRQDHPGGRGLQRGRGHQGQRRGRRHPPVAHEAHLELPLYHSRPGDPEGLRGDRWRRDGLRHALAARRPRLRAPYLAQLRALLRRRHADHVHGGLRHGRVRPS
mmetsp:Transcript_1426/g.3687  ORF Transcript_1426/g.3687 Transcript_1426/m.3687 type:complete len:388 (+) Transcript_1426:674-1837(+)